METFSSADELAETVNQWCERHDVAPASGQAGERISERSIRFYRTLGLVDPPANGGQGYGEKHRLQLMAVRLLQAQGLPLNRIRDLLLGRKVDELEQVQRQGLAELDSIRASSFQPAAHENWRVTPLDDEFMLISRRGRGLSSELRELLLSLLHPKEEKHRHVNGKGRKL